VDYRIRIERPAFLNKVGRFFTSPPCPPVILQISSTFLTGLLLAVNERKARQRLIVPLPPGLVDPRFEKTNIPDSAALAGFLKGHVGRLRGSASRAACLLPETCFRVFVLSFESLPTSDREREDLILFRAKKQLPLPPEDLRLSFQVMESGSGVKVVAALARASVIREYETLFAGLGLELGIVSPPALSLVNLIDWRAETAGLLVNLDDDSLGLVAVTRSEPALYRVKAFAGSRSEARRADGLAKEIENTIHFIEDREKLTIPALWLRTGLLDGSVELAPALAAKLAVTVKPVVAPPLESLPEADRSILTPLAGLIP
jgi:hypothetical protein